MLQTEFLWFLYNFKKIIKRYLNFIKFQGYDNVSILFRTRTALLGAPSRLSISWKNVVGVDIGNYPHIVLIPEEFEFGSYKAIDKDLHLGFLYKIPQEQLSDKEIEIIQKAKIAKISGDIILSIAFGSLYTRFRKKTDTILEKIAKALSNLSNKVFVVVIGRLEKIPSLFDELKYVNIDEIPLKGILEISDLHICHGGINTIKDCLFSHTPMLIFPLNKNWDQPGNAAKVEYHGLGMASSVNVSTETLRSQLTFLLNNFDKSGFQKFIDLENKKYASETESKLSKLYQQFL